MAKTIESPSGSNPIDIVEFMTIVSYALRVAFAVRAGSRPRMIRADDHGQELSFVDVVDVIWNEGAAYFQFGIDA